VGFFLFSHLKGALIIQFKFLTTLVSIFSYLTHGLLQITMEDDGTIFKIAVE
jgi:hypothetical protein